MIRHRRARPTTCRRELSRAPGGWTPTALRASAGARAWAGPSLLIGSAAPPSPSDAFEPERIDYLQDMLGDARFGGLVDLLCVECGERSARLRGAQRRGDLAALHAEAHALLGAATSIGARALGDAALALERVPDLALAGPLVDALDAAAGDTLRAARRLLAALRA